MREFGVTLEPLRGLPIDIKRDFATLFMSQHVGSGEAEKKHGYRYDASCGCPKCAEGSDD